MEPYGGVVSSSLSSPLTSGLEEMWGMDMNICSGLVSGWSAMFRPSGQQSGNRREPREELDSPAPSRLGRERVM